MNIFSVIKAFCVLILLVVLTLFITNNINGYAYIIISGLFLIYLIFVHKNLVDRVNNKNK